SAFSSHGHGIGEDNQLIRQHLLMTSVLAGPLLVLTGASALAQQAASPIDDITPVTDEMLAEPDPADWLMWRRTYNGWGYSPLDQINRDNVGDLQVAWTWSLTPGATETTPLVHDGVLFVYNYADKVQALNAATGDVIWEYRRDLPQSVIDAGGNSLAKRNMAIYQDKLLLATSDVHLVALDVKTGQVVWDRQMGDFDKGWRYTSGPFMAGGVLVQGMTGCGNAQPGGCFITGHDPENGEELWRVNTIARPGEEGGDSWNGLPLENRFGA